ncbi:MAG TPA: glycerophosphodiester phosphodiesterase family protein [Gemmataceae bacterium]
MPDRVAQRKQEFRRLCLALSIGGLLLATGARAEEPRATPPIPALVAHRGLLKHAPENTRAAFGASLDLRLGFELDVRRTRDGYLVCVHDATVDRTTDGNGKVAELTLEALRKLDAGSWFDPAFAGERVPTLDEVFALIARHPPGPLIAVDLKADDGAMPGDLLRLANKHGVRDRLVFIGLAISDPDLRRRLRAADPEAHVAALAQEAKDFAAVLEDRHSDWAYIRFLPTADQVRAAHARGKRVFAVGPLFAGKEPANWQKAREAGVDAILTDFPLECREVWRTAGKPSR